MKFAKVACIACIVLANANIAFADYRILTWKAPGIEINSLAHLDRATLCVSYSEISSDLYQALYKKHKVGYGSFQSKKGESLEDFKNWRCDAVLVPESAVESLMSEKNYSEYFYFFDEVIK